MYEITLLDLILHPTYVMENHCMLMNIELILGPLNQRSFILHSRKRKQTSDQI